MPPVMGTGLFSVRENKPDPILVGTESEPGPISLFVPAPVVASADAALERLAALAPAGRLAGLGGAQLLTERAAISGYTSRGTISPGGSCRLLDAADGGIALNLARDEDWELLPAWLECGVAPEWDAVAEAVRARAARELVQRGREMGLAVAADEVSEAIVGGPHGPDPIAAMGRSHKSVFSRKHPRVLDLSSLWAGPLCGHLLQQLGAEVIKVESPHRPDGARRGPALFFDLLNAGKASVAMDFTADAGRGQLRRLIEGADIVIESSRPRALRQLGVDAAAFAGRRGRVWVGITAYGRAPETENWIGYGDDVGVAAGLSAVVRAATGRRVIAGDAIADPLTGIHAALAAWQAWLGGEGGLIDVSMREVVRRCMNWSPSPINGKWGRTPISKSGGWGEPAPVARHVRAPSGVARALGADTDRILRGP